MFRYVGTFWIFISNYLASLFGFFTRGYGGKSDKKIVDVNQEAHENEKFGATISKESKLGHEKKNLNFEDDLGFELWKVDDFDKKSHEETKAESSVFVEPITTSSNTNKYCFMNQNHVCGYMEVPKSMNFTIHEGFSDDHFKVKDSAVHHDQPISEEGFKTEDFTDKIKVGSEGNLEEKKNDKLESNSLVVYELFTGSNEDSEGETTTEDSTDNDLELEDCSDESTEDVTRQTNRIHVIDDKDADFVETSVFTDEKTKNVDEIPLFVIKFDLLPKSPHGEKLIENHQPDSTDADEMEQNMLGTDQNSVEFTVQTEDELAQNSVEIEYDHEIDSTDHEVVQNMMYPDQNSAEAPGEQDSDLDRNRDQNPCLTEHQLSETTISDSEDESFIEFEPQTGFFNERVFAQLNFGKLDEKQETMDNSERSHEPNLHEEESETLHDDSEKPHEPNSQEEESETIDDGSEKPHEPNPYDEESDSDDEMEHQDYINQLKQELKYVKTRGLPTILEDLESPKVLEDLKPLKIDTKMEHKEIIHEIQKVHKIYTDKMKKLDILSYQTMHSIDLLIKLKSNPTQSNSTKKSPISPLKSLLSFKQSKTQNNPENTTEEAIKELRKDYELVYTGQLCISWEILHWQHKKAKQLQKYDPYGFKQYNHVASEFQQFQVLLQRFIENEPFQETPRIQNYIAYRSAFRSFLQVSSIRDDSTKDKKARQEEKYMINIAMLTDVISESMRLFSEFIRSGREDYITTSRDVHGASLETFEDHVDTELLIDVLEIFRKKEKRVKELLRARSCIVNKLRKNQDEEKLDHSLLNAQIDLKLVEKVINMSKITKEQLIWCHTKLADINFLTRKICLEPSNFLLFLPL